MTNHGRSSSVRRKPAYGQWLMGLFLLLAVIASILMIFGDNLSMTATLAVIAALWAAVIGAVLVTRYRRQADVAETRARDLRLVYELQLEREIAARRIYESEVEATIREELQDESNAELDELKLQVLKLRASLEELLGRPLPESRIALSDLRPRELVAPGPPAYEPADDHAVAQRDFASATGSDDAAYRGPRIRDADRSDDDLTDLIPVVTDEPAYDESGHGESGHGEGDDESGEPGAYSDGYAAAGYADEDYESGEYAAGEYEAAAYSADSYSPPEYDDAEQYDDAGGDASHDYEGDDETAEPIDVEEEAGAHSHGRPAAELLSRFQTAGVPRRSRRRD